MKICNECQNAVVNFYLFRAKVRPSQETFTLLKCAQNSTNVVDEGSIVFHVLDIVKQFIDKYSVESILEDENKQRLIIERHNSSLNTKKQGNDDFDQKTSVEKINDEVADETFEVKFQAFTRTNLMIQQMNIMGNVRMRITYTPSENQSRPKDPDNWIRNKQRTARSKGHAYVTNSGKHVKQKRMQSPCKENCRFKCRS